MLTRFSSGSLGFSFLYGGGPFFDENPEPPTSLPRTFTQDEVNRLLAEEKRTTKKNTEDQVRAEFERLAQEAKDKQDQDDAVKRGDFEKVQTKLEQDLAASKNSVTSMQEQLDFLTEHFESQFESRAEKVDEAFNRFKPGEGASLKERLEWLKSAEEGTEEIGSKPTSTNGVNRTPKSNGTVNDSNKELQKKEARARVSSRI